ncbi:MAG: hypothetical protein ACRDP9_07055 [Kribbellaceae bacterium]
MAEPFSAVVERVLPYDGPHSADTAREAADGLSALVRYLNNATGGWNGKSTLRVAPTVDAIFGGLHATTFGLDQLLTKLAEALERQSADPTLYDDRRDRDAAPTAANAADRVLAVRDAAMDLADAITEVRRLTFHLGHDDVDGGGGVR